MLCNYNFSQIRTIEYDTAVIGGGLAGSCAAISSARGGAKTVLIEAGGTLGGQAGQGLVTPLSSYRSAKGEDFGGLVTEIITDVSALTKKYVCSESEHGKVYTISPHMTKYALLKAAHNSGVDVHFHTVLCDAEIDEGSVTSAIFRDKSGFLRISAKTFVDATGDADLVYLCGDDCVLGSEEGVFDSLYEANLATAHGDGEKCEEYSHSGLMQPVSLFFVMRGVDYEKASSLNNKTIRFGDLGIARERFEKWEFAGTPGFEPVSDHVPMPQDRVLVTRGRHSDEAVVNMSRVININGADAEDLSKGETAAQLQVIAIVDFIKTFIPGFEKSYLVETSSRLGVRESRRLVGKYVLSGRDVITGRHFDDAVCRAFYMIDIHDPTGKHRAIGGDIESDFFEIPFGSLCSKKFSNLLVCGRCISCDHVAHSAARIQGACILTGQAAGCAAAISSGSNTSACEIPTDVLRSELKKCGVNLGK